MKESDFKSRILEFIEWKKMNKSMFCSSIGVSRSYLLTMRTSMSKEKLDVLHAVYPELNINWLMTGEGPMILDGDIDNQTAVIPVDDKNDDKKQNCFYAPLMSLDSVGGAHSNNRENGEEYIERYIPVPDGKPDDRLIYQSGTSMAPAIPPGAILQIREVSGWRDYIGYGDVFVLYLTDERRITKEIRRYDKDPQNYYWCVSYNPDVADEELPKKMVQRVWKVIRVLIDKGW